MVSVEIATNLNDVVQFLGSLRQSVVSTHDLAEFPSVKALVTSEETSGFTRGADERCTTNRTEHVQDEFVAIGTAGRHTLDDAFSHVVLIPVLGFFHRPRRCAVPGSCIPLHHPRQSAVGRDGAHPLFVANPGVFAPHASFGVHDFRFDGHRTTNR